MQPVLVVDCYGELRRIARQLLAREHGQALIDPTELANTVAIRLLALRDDAVNDEGHMLALSARMMRRELIDQARAASAAKRTPPEPVTMWPGEPATAGIDAEALDRALAALADFSPDHARIVELRFTFGLTVEETARLTGLADGEAALAGGTRLVARSSERRCARARLKSNGARSRSSNG